jgi:hypothetical protein
MVALGRGGLPPKRQGDHHPAVAHCGRPFESHVARARRIHIWKTELWKEEASPPTNLPSLSQVLLTLR